MKTITCSDRIYYDELLQDVYKRQSMFMLYALMLLGGLGIYIGTTRKETQSKRKTILAKEGN